MQVIRSQYPSAGPRIERLFASEVDGVEAVLDIWEHDLAWEVGSGYCAEDAEFDRNAASTREIARAEAKRLLNT